MREFALFFFGASAGVAKHKTNRLPLGVFVFVASTTLVFVGVVFVFVAFVVAAALLVALLLCSIDLLIAVCVSGTLMRFAILLWMSILTVFIPTVPTFLPRATYVIVRDAASITIRGVAVRTREDRVNTLFAALAFRVVAQLYCLCSKLANAVVL